MYIYKHIQLVHILWIEHSKNWPPIIPNCHQAQYLDREVSGYMVTHKCDATSPPPQKTKNMLGID